MDDNFTERARKSKELAAAQAQWLRKKAITAENLLYGLLQSGPNLATAVINKMGLGGKLDEELEQAPPEPLAEDAGARPDWDISCKKIVERAAHEAKELGAKFIGTEHLFLGMIAEKVGKVGSLLHDAGVEYPKVRKELLEFLGVKEEKESQAAQADEEGVVEVHIKQRDDCKDLPLPRYMSESASGMDLYAAVDGEVTLEAGGIMLVPTGISMAVPVGYEAQVRPRSGLALKHGITIVNSPGHHRQRLSRRSGRHSRKHRQQAVCHNTRDAHRAVGYPVRCEGKTYCGKRPRRNRPGRRGLRKLRRLKGLCRAGTACGGAPATFAC